MLLSRSVSRLEDDRKAKRPPPFVKLGDGPKSAVRYELGALVQYRNDRRYRSTGEATEAYRSRQAANSLLGFITEGKAMDEWAFALVGGKPVDFIQSLSMTVPDETECRWIALADYLELLRSQIVAESLKHDKVSKGEGKQKDAKAKPKRL